MFIIEYFFFLLLGIVAGFIGGLFGIGGGVILVPSLLFTFYYYGVNKDLAMSMAAATSLSTMILTTLVSTLFHLKKKSLSIKELFKVLPAILLGCLFGILVSISLHSSILAKVFGVVVSLLGIFLLFPKLPNLHLGEFTFWKKVCFTFLLGFLSSLLGIGGGVIAVPVLLEFGLILTAASAFSAFITFSTSLFGSLGYLSFGLNRVSYPHFLGYIYLPAFLMITIGTLFTSAWGTKMAYIWPVNILQKIFSLVLIVTGFIMFFH